MYLKFGIRNKCRFIESNETKLMKFGLFLFKVKNYLSHQISKMLKLFVASNFQNAVIIRHLIEPFDYISM